MKSALNLDPYGEADRGWGTQTQLGNQWYGYTTFQGYIDQIYERPETTSVSFNYFKTVSRDVKIELAPRGYGIFTKLGRSIYKYERDEFNWKCGDKRIS